MTFAEEVWQRRDLLMKIARYDEDLVQETVYTALRNETRFQKDTNLNGWLVTILKNLRNTRHKKYRLELQMPEFVLDSRTVHPVGSRLSNRSARCPERNHSSHCSWSTPTALLHRT